MAHLWRTQGHQIFYFVEIDEAITDTTVAQVRHYLLNRAYREKMTQHNYQTAKQHYSYQTLTDILAAILP